MKIRCLLTALLSSLFAASAFACDYCSIYTPLSARELIPQTAYAGIRQDLIGYGKTRGENSDEARRQNLKTNVTELNLAFDFTSSVGLMAEVPFVFQKATRLEGS